MTQPRSRNLAADNNELDLKRNDMNLSRLTVLIVEDDEDDALLVRELLLYAQYDTFAVVVAERLAGALEQIASRRFDLILLDLSLPDSQGLDTLSQIRLQAADIP